MFASIRTDKLRGFYMFSGTGFLRIRDICNDRKATSTVPLLISFAASIWMLGVRAILILKLIFILMDLIAVLRDLLGA
jgi:hypothetical protein